MSNSRAPNLTSHRTEQQKLPQPKSRQKYTTSGNNSAEREFRAAEIKGNSNRQKNLSAELIMSNYAVPDSSEGDFTEK